MLEHLQPVPGDPLLSLMVAYKNDTRANKIDLGVGVYKDNQGNTPVLDCVKKAETWLLENETTKTYIGSAGAPALGLELQRLILGADNPLLSSGRLTSVQSTGGTGALRIAGDFIHRSLPNATLWASDPTWANHYNVFESAGITVKSYPYYDAANQSLKFDEMMATLATVPAGDVVLLHACCHNPTGIDLTPAQWQQVGELLKERQIMPLVDLAYLGFATDENSDVEGVRILAQLCDEMLIASSCSKNFGLYNERIGGLTLLAKNERDAQAGYSQICYAIRGNYSMPPNHGAAIVTCILQSEDLKAQWLQELADMRGRINTMRNEFVQKLNEQGLNNRFDFIADQRGMFSFSGLNPQQVKRLQEEDAIYIVGSGRINVAGMTPDNLPRLCSAIARVVKG